MSNHTNEKVKISRLVAAIILGLFMILESTAPVFAGDSAPAEEPASATVAEETSDAEEPVVSNDSGDAITTQSENGGEANLSGNGEKDGIIEEDGQYFFYVENELQTNTWVKQDGKVYYASEDGSFLVDQFFKVDSKKYYVNSNGEVQTGIFTIDGKKYFASTKGEPAGAIRTGWFKEDGKQYVANSEGALKTNQWIKAKSPTLSNVTYKYRTDSNGAFKTGNYKIGDYYYHGAVSGKNAGHVITGTRKDNGKTYVADKNGHLKRNKWIVKSSTKRYYVGGNGAYVAGTTKVIGKIPYRFRKDGKMVVQKGFFTYKGNHYYKNSKGLPVKKTMINYNGHRYYMGKDGLAVKNKWVTIAGARCYFNSKGVWVQNVKDVPFDKSWKYTGSQLTVSKGVYNGPGGRETYYNMYMGDVISTMRRMGFDSKRYPYWIRSDGVRMLGPYVIVAANFGIRPRGSVVCTSRGLGLVCDTGGFIAWSPMGIDIAVTW